MSHYQPGSPDLDGFTESTHPYMERGGKDLGEVHEGMVVQHVMIERYRALDKELKIQSHKAQKLDPSDTEERNWTKRMIADRTTYKAEVKRLAVAKTVQGASEVALLQGNSTDLTALYILCARVVRDDQHWFEAAYAYVPQISDS